MIEALARALDSWDQGGLSESLTSSESRLAQDWARQIPIRHSTTLAWLTPRVPPSLCAPCRITEAGGDRCVIRRHGHPVGDQVLVETSKLLRARVEGKGKAYRYGGVELAVLLQNYTPEEATALAEVLYSAP